MITPRRIAAVSLTTLVLTGAGGAVAGAEPSAPPPVAVATITATSIASNAENAASEQNFISIVTTATTTGGIVGLAAGAVLGCLVGLPAAGIGCIPGIAAFAPVGGVIGTIVFGGPAMVAAGVDLGQTLLAAPGTTHWSH